MSTINRKAIRAKVRRRIRRKVSGTASRPRLAVYFSNRHVYAQIIDDTVGRTICSASTADASIADPSKLANCATATKVGNLIGERAKAANVTEVVFDRGGFKFCGKVKALADAAGVSRQTINAIEQGEYNPTIKLCLTICRALGKTLDELFWEDEEDEAF